MERVKGTIIELIYYNEENCYTVIGVENPEMDFVAVGYLPNAEKGRTFVFEGTWKNHATYGEQFSFTAFTEEMPSTAEGIEAFLASGLLKGIGKKTAKLIVDRFGEDTLRVIEETPMRLMEISGIGEAKANSVAEAYKAHREFAQITVYFQQYGISPGYAMKLYKVYGSDTIRAVEENPYQLVDDIFGIGFKKADAIAEKLGIARDSEFRIRSGIEYALWAYTGEGHTFIPQKLFCEKTAEFLDISANDIYEMTVQMAFEGDVHLETLEGRSVIFPMALWKAEQNVCAKLMELNDAMLSHIASDEEMERLISSIESETGLELSGEQRFAVSSSLKNGVSVITGVPGTGKTTILNT
ncbi:MAG: ATP-dependent RecD-like DNA helicase, partial [Firmicutes bacterium]|nr:ATP-dependent RecD-like DNA helicase [Bacillota bacterium]